ncbi:hypothetical protein HHI36_018146 [Cryptolaemus montrouzieri]|uniref:Uncharacterized protein n=1 Tax=Cryptolaemus montrouzieri TaxID=559131 RepID=A0ABD2P041_9CUCU
MIVLILVVLTIYLLINKWMKKKSDSLRCLMGKTAIVTGGNSGAGYGIATLLASRGCKVIIADCVNGENSRDEIIRKTQNPNVSYKYVDLSSLKTVREFCEGIKISEKKIDILINNAAIGLSTNKMTADGLNHVMQVNFFGAFLLTHLLLEPLKNADGARVIFVSSATALLHNLRMENLNLTDYPHTVSYIKQFYANSKLCNIMAARVFAKRLKKYGITAYSVDPLLVGSQLFRKFFEFVVEKLWKICMMVCMNEVEAAETYLHLASSEKLDNSSGGHYAACSKMFIPRILKNEQFCEEIWDETEKLVKLEPEERL